MAYSTNISKLSMITFQIKIKQRIPPEHHKISLQQFSQISTHLSKNQKTIRPFLNFAPEVQKIFDEHVIFSRHSKNYNHKLFILLKLLITFFIETFEALTILSITFCNLFSIFYSLFEISLQLSQIIDHIHRYDNLKYI